MPEKCSWKVEVWCLCWSSWWSKSNESGSASRLAGLLLLETFQTFLLSQLAVRDSHLLEPPLSLGCWFCLSGEIRTDGGGRDGRDDCFVLLINNVIMIPGIDNVTLSSALVPSNRVLHQTGTMLELSPGTVLIIIPSLPHQYKHIQIRIIRLIRISNSSTRNVGHGQFNISTNLNIFSLAG